MTISRRVFLNLLAASGAAMAAPTAALAEAQWTPRPEDLLPGDAFRHGVASGDPLQSRVMLWTRVTPDAPDNRILVQCSVATDPMMNNIIGKYSRVATAETDFTIKVDAHDLEPDRTYYYQFYAKREASPIGRTRTLPTETDNIRLGVVSCSNLPAGFFGAYGLLAQQYNLNAILHLGDYIYEYANGTYGDGTDLGRIPEPNTETVSLADYRTRLSQYRRDGHLQEAHRLHPWIMVWDDHEIANDAYQDGAQNHQAGEGDWEIRKAAAIQAYFEWLPLRDKFGVRQTNTAIFRRFRFGDLAQLEMLDTRLFGREQQAPQLLDPLTFQLLVTPEELFRYLSMIDETDRQLLGSVQERWLHQQMEKASQDQVQWNVLGQQVMMGQLTLPVSGLPTNLRVPLNPDQWDGYPSARKRVLDLIDAAGIENTVVLSGDFHSSWSNDIAPDPYDTDLYDPMTGEGSKAVEFVGPAVSSPFFVGTNPAVVKSVEQLALRINRHTKYVDMEKNGYMIVDIDRYRARAEFYHLDDVLNPDTGETMAAAVESATGTHHVELVEGGVS